MQKFKQTLATIVLAPVLIYQGRKVSQSIIRLPEAAGDRSGIVNPSENIKEPKRLLILGDSSAAGVGAKQQQQALTGQILSHIDNSQAIRWQLIAESGATTLKAHEMLVDQIKPETYFDVAVLALGVNDVKSNITLNQWLNHQAELVEYLTSQLQCKQIIISALPPMGSFTAWPQPLRWWLGNWADLMQFALEQQFSSKAEVDWVKMPPQEDQSFLAEDGFHPSPKSYTVWGALVAKLISDFFK